MIQVLDKALVSRRLFVARYSESILCKQDPKGSEPFTYFIGCEDFESLSQDWIGTSTVVCLTAGFQRPV